MQGQKVQSDNQIIGDNQSLENEDLAHRHYGQTLPIGVRDDGQPKYLLGPHFIVFFITLCFTTILLFYMAYDITSNTKGKTISIGIATISSTLIYIYTYLKIGFSNPGIASSSQQLNQQQKKHERHCKPCKIIRPQKVIHCLSCDLCIIDYDHHCLWVGKCIGRDNLYNFKLFLFSIFLTIGTFALCLYTAQTYQQIDHLS